MRHIYHRRRKKILSDWVDGDPKIGDYVISSHFSNDLIFKIKDLRKGSYSGGSDALLATIEPVTYLEGYLNTEKKHRAKTHEVSVIYLAKIDVAFLEKYIKSIEEKSIQHIDNIKKFMKDKL